MEVLKLVLVICAAIVSSNEVYVRPRIVGGWPVADVRSVPYMISIQVCSKVSGTGDLKFQCPERNQRHDCGGCLVSSSLIVTSCHCVADVSLEKDGPARKFDERKVKWLAFVAGTENIFHRGPHTQVRFASDVYIDPRCGVRRGNIVFDLGLAQMTEEFQINSFVHPVKVYGDDSVLHGAIKKIESYDRAATDQPNCIVSGWGDTRKGQPKIPEANAQLKAVRMYIIPESECVQAYMKRDYDYNNYSFAQNCQICAVSLNGDESDCVGDSGSPFVCSGFLIALVSYGYECGSPHPSVYQLSSVSNKWINMMTHSERQRRLSSPSGRDKFRCVASIVITCFVSIYKLAE